MTIKQSLHKDEIPQLIQQLTDIDDAVRSQAAEDLGRFSVLKALPALVPLLDDPDADVRSSATFALTNLAGDLWERPPEFMPDDGPELVRLIKQRVIPKFIELLSDPSSEVRVWAIDGLDELNVTEAIPQLVAILEDKDASVRFHSAEALGKLGDERALPALKKLINDSTFKGREAREVRYKARKAIKLIENRIS